MAIRVRKLAKEVRRSSGEVLGLLHTLGYVNYKRVDDMVADAPADKLRRAVKQGKTAPPLAVQERARSTASAAPPADDLMAQLVPGVVRQGVPTPPRPTPPPRKVSPPPTPTPAPQPAPPPAPAPSPTAAATAALEAERDALLERVRTLEAERDGLQQAHDTLLAAQRKAEAMPPEGVTVASLLEARGLRGSDEVLRGVEALIAFRQGLGLLDARLGPAAAVELERAIANVVLLDGPPPQELTLPAVAVAEDRAEGPGAATLDRLSHELSEHMMLSGWRRLALVGVPPRWHAAIRVRLDRRVEVTFQPAGVWSAEQVARMRADLVGAVGLQAPEEALEQSSATWVADSDLGAVLRRLVRAARGEG